MLILRVEIMTGSQLTRTCQEVTELANNNGMLIIFDYNGITCNAYPGSSAEDMEITWQNADKAGRKRAFSTQVKQY